MEKQRYSRKRALAAEPRWNDLQQNILNLVESGLNHNLQIGAVAGSGKTSVLSAIVNRLPTSARIGVLAFNKHIAEAMAEKVPSRVTATTAHSMGYGLLCRVFAGKVQVDGSKYKKIAKGVIEENIDLTPWTDAKTDIRRLGNESIDFAVEMIRLCQATLCEPRVEDMVRMIDYYSIEINLPFPVIEQILCLIGVCLEIGEMVAREQQIIDFGDMLWLVERWGLPVNEYNFLLVDEIQDANNAQLALYKRLLGNSGKLIAVGDENQSIMGFAFSTPDMWEKIRRTFNTTSLPMSVCFRCPASHLDLARVAVPTIRAADNAAQGEIQVVSPAEIKDRVESGDLIICRFTAPLVSLCLKLIVQKIQARVRGRDIGASLAALITQATKGRGVGWAGFAATFYDYCNPRIKKLKETDQQSAADNLTDRMMAVLACHEHFRERCKDLEQFKAEVQDLFSDDSTPVILSTIHRAKGDEADRVWLLQTNALPYTNKCRHEWQEQQERNLTYVALTRAKKTLFLAPLVRSKGNVDEASLALDDLLRDPWGGLNLEELANGNPVINAVERFEQNDVPDAPIDVPNIGDRVAVYQYTPPNPSPDQIRAWMSNPWIMPLDPTWNKLQCWGNYPIVVVKRIRQKQSGEIRLIVTSAEFPEPLRSEGVLIPLGSCELLESGYGLPDKETQATQRAEVILLDDARKKREEKAGKQGVLL